MMRSMATKRVKKTAAKKAAPARKRVTKATFPRVCNLIAQGKSLREIGRISGMPKSDTVRRWILEDDDLAAQYARAKKRAMDAMAEEILEIADEGKTGVITLPDGSTQVVLDKTAVQRNRLRIDTRKWLMAKLAPKKYGDRLELESKHSFEGVSTEAIMDKVTALMSRAGADAGGD